MDYKQTKLRKVKDWENIYRTKGIVQNDVLYTVKHASKLMKKNKCSKVLDLCCGTGRHTLYLAANNFNVYGIDNAASAIDITKKRLYENGFDNMHLKIGNMFDINFPENFFDALLCVWSTGHGLKNDVKKSVQEMRRVVKEGGLVCADFMSVKDRNFNRGRAIEECTFFHDHIDHPDVPHHYSSVEEIEEFFCDFRQKKIEPIIYFDYVYKCDIHAFWVEAIK
jgi:ubiquinone/menaquinone biosynthesis C-methylase UbiE